LSSLQSAYIRNSILRALRETRPDAAKLVSASFVYEHSTIERIATFLSKAVADPHSTQRVDLTVRGQELQALVDKYTEGFPSPLTLNGSAYPVLCGDVCLLTGTTGSLGSNMLAQLLEAPEVTRVYAFNRPSKAATLRARQLSAFKERGLNTDLLSSEKLVYVEGDLNAPGFALADELYGDVSIISPSLRLVVALICNESHRSINQSRTSFITVRHCLFHHTTPLSYYTAWTINLNLSLTSFEGCISSVRVLVDFALTSPLISPPHLLFVSSIAVFTSACRFMGFMLFVDCPIQISRTRVRLRRTCCRIRRSLLAMAMRNRSG